MIRYLFIFLLPFTLYGAKILSYNIYDRTDRVDVMITFDKPYNGTIKQNQSSSNIIIKLEGASIESAKNKKFSSKYLTSLNISPMAGYTQISAATPPSVALKVSKTSDSYGLRLRFLAQPATKQATSTQESEPQSQNKITGSLPTKKDGDLSNSYYIVIAILILGIVILLYIKTKVTPKKQNSSWLFNPNKEPEEEKSKEITTQDDGVSIRFQKNIKDSNSVVMLDFLDQSYLVLMGSNNILLDKFTDNKPTTQDEFEQILQSRHQQLDDFLQVPNNTDPKKAFDSYREKASSISYDV